MITPPGRRPPGSQARFWLAVGVLDIATVSALRELWPVWLPRPGSR